MELDTTLMKVHPTVEVIVHHAEQVALLQCRLAVGTPEAFKVEDTVPHPHDQIGQLDFQQASLALPAALSIDSEKGEMEWMGR